ncbi:MAG: response regulator transcription factor [Roseburia sp.]
MRVLVVDDDQLVAVSLKTILEADGAIEVVATGKSGAEAVELYRLHKPDVLLMDIRMEEMNGLEAAERIFAEDAGARILFLTTFSDDEYIVRALNIGAKGYILKQDFEGIVPALKAVWRGQSVFGGEIVGKLPVLLQPKEEFDYSAYDISEKEQEITRLVAEGMSNREIAEQLFLSEGTVRNYISSILEKLGLRDRTQLAVFHLKGGISR